MDAPLDRYGASRHEVAELILAQRDQIAEWERRLAGPAAERAALQAVVGHLTEQLGPPARARCRSRGRLVVPEREARAAGDRVAPAGRAAPAPPPRLWPAADGAHAPAGPCRHPLSALPPPLDEGHDQAHA